MESLKTEIPQDIEKELFENVMKHEWEKVVNIYGKYPRTHKIKVTSSDQTALHVAISEAKDQVVQELVQHIKRESDPFDVLKLQTEKGYTPLHLAAATGRSGTRCKICIDSVDDREKAKELVRLRDKKGETPLFRAVHYGRQRPFLYLHSILGDAGEDLSFCVRDDGQSILHDAIIRENFDLAFQIIHLYKGLVNRVDNQGDSPLHALARKAAAFRSGSTLRGRDRIIYNCISVEELPEQEVKNEAESSHLEKNTVEFATGIGHVKKEGTFIDIESGDGPNSARENQHLTWSSNTSCFWYFVNFVCMKMPFIFGYGYMAVAKIYAEKKKHVWADQVLNGLLKDATMYDKKNHVLEPGQRQKVKEKHLKAEVFNELKDRVLRPGQGKKSGMSDEVSDGELNGDSEEEFGDDYSESSRMELSSLSSMNAAGKAESLKTKKDTAILVAAKYGICEMVEKIIEYFPVAIYDDDKDRKNVLLVAVEKRHLNIYKLLIKKYPKRSIVFQRVDREGNTALHFAATYDKSVRPWPVPGAALQMQWEIKWLEYVENTMSSRLFLRTNTKGETPREIFSSTHEPLIKAGGEWLISMATSCSVVAALIVTIAFSSSTTVPGGTDSNTGKPTLRNNPTFDLFAIASLVSLCFSVTSLITFLAILTSRHQEKDFGKKLPSKILMGLTSLFVSIATMLVTFCAGHFLVFEDKIKYAAFPIYAVTFFPLCLFAAAQFPLYFDLFQSTFWSPF
ncbi:hypothetical protein UlMin_005276 [Ulmus minor]